MNRVSISELKARLSEYLEAVRAGEEVIVTDRGRPVARIAPVSGPEDSESRLQMLIRTGQARPPDRAGGLDLELLRAHRPTVPGAGLSEAIIEERREGR
jgi:prevent-host-death family protein